MGQPEGKRLLIVVRRAPYGSSLARTALDTALAAAAFDQPVNILFLGDGVLQLQAGQDTAALGLKNCGRLLASLPLYDIDKVYADAAAVERYCMLADSFPVPAELLDHHSMAELMANSDHLLGF
jgi:tRNA 2-thiouridine synthesizing protein C